MIQLATIQEIEHFLAQLLPHAIKTPWANNPVSSQILANLCLEKGIVLPKLHPCYYNDKRQVRHYLDHLLDRFFVDSPEFVSGRIMIRKDRLPVGNTAGLMLPKAFYSFKRVRKRRVK